MVERCARMHGKAERITERFFEVERFKGGKESSKGGTGGRETDSWTVERCNRGKGSNSGGTGGSWRFKGGGRV